MHYALVSANPSTTAVAHSTIFIPTTRTLRFSLTCNPPFTGHLLGRKLQSERGCFDQVARLPIFLVAASWPPHVLCTVACNLRYQSYKYNSRPAHPPTNDFTYTPDAVDASLAKHSSQ